MWLRVAQRGCVGPSREVGWSSRTLSRATARRRTALRRACQAQRKALQAGTLERAIPAIQTGWSTAGATRNRREGAYLDLQFRYPHGHVRRIFLRRQVRRCMLLDDMPSQKACRGVARRQSTRRMAITSFGVGLIPPVVMSSCRSLIAGRILIFYNIVLPDLSCVHHSNIARD